MTASESARRRGILPPGLAPRAIFCVCQKIASRPFTCVKTIWERASRGPIEDEIDRRSPPATEQDGRLLDDLGLGGPRLLEAVAVDAGGRRPGLARLQDDPVLEREPEQVGQLAVCVRVPGDQEHASVIAHAAAA